MLQKAHSSIEGKEGFEIVVLALGVHDPVADLVDSLRNLVTVVALYCSVHGNLMGGEDERFLGPVEL